MKLVEDKFFDKETREMHDWLCAQVSSHIDTVVSEMKEKMPFGVEPSEDELQDMHRVAKALVLAQMPARLHLMKIFFLQSHVVGTLKERYEKDPDNEYLRLKVEAEEASRSALHRYMIETEVEERDDCDCERCRARREAQQFESATGIDKDAVQLRQPIGDMKEGAFMVPMDEFDGSIPPDALKANITHAYRCKDCRALVMTDADDCSCGAHNFGPVVIVDLPVEEMDALQQMKEAESQLNAIPGNKVMH